MVLYGIVWYCIVLYGIVWYCMVLCCVVLYCIVLYRVIFVSIGIVLHLNTHAASTEVSCKLCTGQDMHPLE